MALDPAVQQDEAPAAQEAIDGRSADPGVEELTSRDDAVLARRKRGDVEFRVAYRRRVDTPSELAPRAARACRVRVANSTWRAAHGVGAA